MYFSLVIDANSVNRLVDVQCVEATSGQGIEGVVVSAYTMGVIPSLVSQSTTDYDGRCQLSVPVNSSYDFKAELEGDVQSMSNIYVDNGSQPFDLGTFSFD